MKENVTVGVSGYWVHFLRKYPARHSILTMVAFSQQFMVMVEAPSFTTLMLICEPDSTYHILVYPNFPCVHYLLFTDKYFNFRN